MYYLEIFEDDVDSAVTAFLESGPLKKQLHPLSQVVEETDNTLFEQPQLSAPVEELHGQDPQEQETSPLRDRREEQQDILPQPQGVSKSNETFVTRTLHNYFKSHHPAAAETEGS